MRPKLLSLAPCFSLPPPQIYKDWKLCLLYSIELYSLTILRSSRSNWDGYDVLSFASPQRFPWQKIFFTSLISGPQMWPAETASLMHRKASLALKCQSFGICWICSYVRLFKTIYFDLKSYTTHDALVFLNTVLPQWQTPHYWYWLKATFFTLIIDRSSSHTWTLVSSKYLRSSFTAGTNRSSSSVKWSVTLHYYYSRQEVEVRARGRMGREVKTASFGGRAVFWQLELI